MRQPTPPYPTNTSRMSPATAAATGADDLANIVAGRYRDAVAFRNSTASAPNGKTLAANMEEARRLYQGILSPAQEEISADVCGVKINLVRTKASVLSSWLADITTAGQDRLITIDPTPNPSLSNTGKEMLRQDIWDTLVSKLKEQGYPADEAAIAMMPPDVQTEIKAWLAKTSQDLKAKAHLRELSIATDAAKKMETHIHDMLIEANFRKHYTAFVDDFASLPFAVLKSPTVESVMVPGWKGDKWGMHAGQRVGVRRVSPWDFLFSGDSTDANNGAYVIERIALRRDQLMAMAKSDNWVKSNVIEALEYYQRMGPIDWINPPAQASASKASAVALPASWNHGETVSAVQMHGLFSGRELKRYNVGAGLDDNEFCEAVITVLGGFVIQARLQVVPQGGMRPYHTASFAPSTEHAVGLGLPNLLADVQVAAYSAFWAMTRNASLSAGARGEVDFSRIKGFIDERATPEAVLAQPFHFVEPDISRTAGGAPAFKFSTIPNNTTQYLTLMHELMQRADDQSGIPAIVGGEMQNATMGRAFRTVSTLFGAATRKLKATLTNLDTNVLGPVGESLYRYVLTHELDQFPEFKGLDANCRARGTSGLLEAEIKAQGAVEALQTVPALLQIAEAGGTKLPEGLVLSIVEKAATGLGIDTSGYPELHTDAKFGQAVNQATISNLGPASVPKV